MNHVKSSILMKNRKLRTERRQHGWTQARLAQALGVTTRTVVRWEQGQSVPQPNYRKKLGTLFGKTAQELGLFCDADEMPTSNTVDLVRAIPHTLAPIRRSDITTQAPLLVDPAIAPTLGSTGSLLGQSRLLMQVKAYLLQAEGLPKIALSGLPGIGKTTLATALATDEQVQARFSGGILWAPLGPLPHLLSQLMRWGTLLGVTPSQVKDPESLAAWGQALQWAIGTRPMLLILEDAWTAEDALSLHVGGPQCTHLLTTHQSQVAEAFAQQCSIAVPPLEEADGLALLAQFVPHLIQQDPQGAQSLVRALGCLPLALTLMGKFLASSALADHLWPLQVALMQLQESQEYLRLSMPIASGRCSSSFAEMALRSLYTTIAICVRQLSHEALTALFALTIFPAKPHSFSEEAALVVGQQSKEVLDQLCTTGLLEIWGSRRYSLHQTVVDYVRTKIMSHSSTRVDEQRVEGHHHVSDKRRSLEN